MTITHFHIGLNIDFILEDEERLIKFYLNCWPDSNYPGVIEYFKNLQEKGYRSIPFGDCNHYGLDGCLGHEKKDRS